MQSQVTTRTIGPIRVVSIDRAASRNAVDGLTAAALARAFVDFENDDNASVGILYGAHGTFCAGADLKAVARNQNPNPMQPATGERMDEHGPMGPTRLQLTKPVIAAISGHAVAGGLELALWCDMRVAEQSAVLGVFCRRWGVPLIDGGTVRLPRLIGHGRAMDLILTGRPVGAEEALSLGLVNRIAPDGQSLEVAMQLAEDIARFPQDCLRSDRQSAIDQWGLGLPEALQNEFNLGSAIVNSGAAASGANRFAAGKGRGGDFESI